MTAVTARRDAVIAGSRLELGTDIVSVPRIAALIEARGNAFLQRWFTELEIDYCTAKAAPSRHFAARVAAKEAVSKALPVPWDGPLPWRSIEIRNGERGAPSVALSGPLAAAADRAGVREVTVSLSHCDEYATATALAACTGPTGPTDTADDADDAAEARP